MKISSIIIPLVVAFTAYKGVGYTKAGLKSWYSGLNKPSWTPSGKLIKEIWIFLYILVTVAVMLFWIVTVAGVWHYVLTAVLLLNAYLNATWNKAFFVEHNFSKAYKRMIYLNITTVIAIIIMWPIYLLPALLLIPYVIWVGIATKLTKEIWKLNRS
ncbi:MAG TPA: tryptophan-rich sensory protein [Candidatus Doudnabacteria bacterium]|nr:tryptophan-rich sensory protein [Candidatus Doudnabacteria bacterium]